MVDDNQTHIDCVLDYIDWEKYSITEIKTAKNGIAGLEIFRTFKPDLVITDVVMPLSDGLEFSKCIREIDNNAHIIFMSCHEDFGYVKHALDYDITAYILKPIDPDELEANVAKIIEQLNKEKNNNISAITELMPLIREGILSRLLYRENPEISNEILESSSLLNYKYYIVIKCIILEKNDNTTFLAEIIKLLSEFLSLFFVNSFTEPPNKAVIVISGNDEDPNIFMKNCKDKLSEFSKIVLEENGIKTSFGVSHVSKSILDANTMLNQATLALEYAEFPMPCQIYFFDEIPVDMRSGINEKGTQNDIVDNIKTYIDVNFKDIPTVDHIASQLYISSGYAKNIFKKYTGKTIFEYLVDRRIKEAMKLLSDPKNKVYEVSELIGYTSKAHFTETFKKKTGMLPKEYQQHCLKNS